MPRNSSGTYSLPAGNPVVTATVISSAWANSTLSDLGTAMTDSLSRTGQGGMLTTLLLADGAVGAPGLSWTNETTSGLYRAGASDHRYSLAGVDRIQILAQGLMTVAGSAALPSHSFIADPNTGVYSVSADDLGFSTGGTLRLDISTSAVTSTLPWRGQDGAVGAPSLSFSSDTDNGFYRSAADTWNAAVGGVRVTRFLSSGASNVSFTVYGGDGTNSSGAFVVNNTAASATLFEILGAGQAAGSDGTAGAPGFSFISDLDTGFYHVAANQPGVAAGGSRVWSWSTAQAFALDGTASLPGISFDSDPDSGWFRNAANDIRGAAGGSTIIGFDASRFFALQQIQGPAGSAATPSFSTSDSDTGMYSSGANELSFSTGGTFAGRFLSTQQLAMINGSNTAPAYSFNSDTNTGMYSVGSDELGFTSGGVLMLDLLNNGTGGVVSIGISSSTAYLVSTLTATTANTGAAGAPPAQVVGYLQWNINGTTRKIPYYAN